MKILAIIPARGGSKRIPKKNIKEFCGRPVIAWPIGAALRSRCFDEVMVSTDSEEIAAVAREYGAGVPFMRSAKAADDYATTADVLLEVLDEYERRGCRFDAVACIYATAPFIREYRLREACRLLESGMCESAFTCVEYSYPVQRGLRVCSDGMVCMRFPEYSSARSQDLEPTYHDAGQFYVCTVESLRRDRSLWGQETRPIVLPELEVQDLDTETDWKLAEMKYEIMKFPHHFDRCDDDELILNYVYATVPMQRELLRHRNSDSVRRQMVNGEIIPEDDHFRWLGTLEGNNDKAYYAVIDRTPDFDGADGTDFKVKGSVNFEWVAPGVMERGIWIAEDYRGKGLARRILKDMYEEIAERMGVRKIVTRVRIGNEASNALELSLGAIPVRRDDGYQYYELAL